jgi:hypothetical protein
LKACPWYPGESTETNHEIRPGFFLSIAEAHDWILSVLLFPLHPCCESVRTGEFIQKGKFPTENPMLTWGVRQF